VSFLTAACSENNDRKRVSIQSSLDHHSSVAQRLKDQQEAKKYFRPLPIQSAKEHGQLDTRPRAPPNVVSLSRFAVVTIKLSLVPQKYFSNKPIIFTALVPETTLALDLVFLEIILNAYLLCKVI